MVTLKDLLIETGLRLDSLKDLRFDLDLSKVTHWVMHLKTHLEKLIDLEMRLVKLTGLPKD